MRKLDALHEKFSGHDTAPCMDFVRLAPSSYEDSDKGSEILCIAGPPGAAIHCLQQPDLFAERPSVVTVFLRGCNAEEQQYVFIHVLKLR